MYNKYNQGDEAVKSEVYSKFVKGYMDSNPDVNELMRMSIPLKSHERSVYFMLMTGTGYNWDKNFSSLKYRNGNYIDHFDMTDDIKPIESVVLADYGKLSIVFGHNYK